MDLRDFGFYPYVDPRTGTLHNLVGACSPDALKEIENTLVSLRLTELKGSPVQGKLDFEHLKQINRRLFQDEYPWAGQPRANFDAAKQAYESEKAHAFTPSAQTNTEARRIFGTLADNYYPRGLSREDFIPALAKLHGELNQLYTFPEGNGRTQRLFLEQLAERAGHRVDLSIGTQHRIIEASIAQTNGLHGMMERFIAEAADPQRVKAMREALNHLSEVKDREFVASLYIVATVPGEKYKGVLYGLNGRDFIMRTNDSKLIVGHAVDLPRGAPGCASNRSHRNKRSQGEHFIRPARRQRTGLEQFVEKPRTFSPFSLLPFLSFLISRMPPSRAGECGRRGARLPKSGVKVGQPNPN